jgi:DNA replication and repair protein RecF
LSEHVGFLPVVMITPDDTYLATDGSEARRRFLDNTISQLDHQYLQHLILYNKLLGQRNALLKQFAEQKRFDASLLQAYTIQMLEPGNAIFEKRRHYVQVLQPMIQAAYRAICDGQEEVDVNFRSRLLEEPLEKLMGESLEKDRVLQRTTAGPHKDDLIFTIKGYPLKRFASQGQLKSYILALKLAQYQLLQQEKQLSPFLLLDDIFDKLDQSRVSHLLKLLLEQPYGQLFITDTDETRLPEILRQHQRAFLLYNIHQGKATKLQTNE